jgi:hypothetical protein
MRLDYKDKFPSGMEEYLSMYGWHFSKKMCEWASSKMYKNNNGKKEYIDPYTRNRLDDLLNIYGIKLRNNKGYDDVYIANMCKADFLGDSVKGEDGLVLYVRGVIDDPDGYEGLPFTRFYADCIGSGTPIPWEDVL